MNETTDKEVAGNGSEDGGQQHVFLSDKISYMLNFTKADASNADESKYFKYRSGIRQAYKRNPASISNEQVQQLKDIGVDITMSHAEDIVKARVLIVLEGYSGFKQNATPFTPETEKAIEFVTNLIKTNDKRIIPHLQKLQKCGFCIFVPAVEKQIRRCICCLLVGQIDFAFVCPGRTRRKNCQSIKPIPLKDEPSYNLDTSSPGVPPQVTSVEVASASEEVLPLPKYMIGYCFFKAFDDGKEYEGMIMNFFFNYGVRYEDGSTGELDEFELNFLDPAGSVMTDNERLERQKEGEKCFDREDQYGLKPAQLEDFLKRPCYYKSYQFKNHFVGKGFLTGKVESMYYSYYCRFNDGDTATIDETEMETLRRIPDRSYLHFDRDGNFVVCNTSGGDVDLEGFVSDWLEKDIHQMESLHRPKSRIVQTNKKYAPISPIRRHRNSLSPLDDDDDDGGNDALSFVDEEEGFII
mmetsp:Transcript_17947/g.43535  ORF Transcript_17947/g.43535 Transcript_17947/m.43535 type:complete len:467 (+) Transcript_17947:319-1719(+)|eukprot:CAMPEP_0113463378 /NCGR_PEP_ID=MMETSP0014_2-20120614/12616_1 /TAXON_ID=2857 /ORGANISM="Nitzschia sp." /LENGTH=466 /DNA_ID=CAMNT_0000355349 /DNA_START=205 /DNA_END=1605 /DNA_ORIENTATION=- /assembly_acc=CAM_ASM_000159